MAAGQEVSRRPRPIVVRVSGPAGLADIVRREVATALVNIGAFEVTSRGEPAFAGDGGSCDPERLKLLADIAGDGVEVLVELG